jgi:CBS domain-containing protein
VLATKVMRRSFEKINPMTSLVEAARLLLQTNQRGLPVVDENGGLIGILSEGDLLHRDELGVTPPAGNWLEDVLGIEENSPARKRMRTLNVATIMTKNPVCVDEHATVDDVVALMDQRKVAQIPVVNAGKVVGMISRFELLEALERKLRVYGEIRSAS